MIAIKKMNQITDRSCKEVETEALALMRVNHINVIKAVDYGHDWYVPNINPEDSSEKWLYIALEMG